MIDRTARRELALFLALVFGLPLSIEGVIFLCLTFISGGCK